MLATFDYVTTSENKGSPHSGLTPWGNWVGGLYPGQQHKRSGMWFREDKLICSGDFGTRKGVPIYLYSLWSSKLSTLKLADRRKARWWINSYSNIGFLHYTHHVDLFHYLEEILLVYVLVRTNSTTGAEKLIFIRYWLNTFHKSLPNMGFTALTDCWTKHCFVFKPIFFIISRSNCK